MVMLLLALGLVGSTALAAPPSPWGPAPAPIGWGATKAEWRLVIREGQPVRVEGRYVLTSVDPQSATLTLVGPELLVTEVKGPVVATPAGLTVALDPDKRRVDQSFVGLLEPASAGSLSLPVLDATRTHVVVDAPGLDVTIDGAVDGWLAPTRRLSVSWRPHVDGEKPYEQLVTQGEAGATFRGDAGGLTVDAVVRWRVVRGEAKRLTFAANGLEELEVAGEGVAKWRREGDTVIVEPKAPVKGLFSVVVKGRAPLGKSQRSVPIPEPTNVLRVDRFVTMARSDEGELIPVAMPESVPLAKVPAWAKNLGDGVPLVAWHGPQPVQVLPGAFETVQGPDTVITQARYTYAAAAEGHAALRMNLRVRNERRQFLHLRPGKGWRPVVIRVGNQPVSWLSDGEGGIYVPLEKSVETVKGLLSFPVDVEWIGEAEPIWEKRGEMELSLPSVDAPVQAATWEVHLPRGYQALRRPERGTGRILLGDLREKPVDDESGYASAERERQEVVSSALQNAVSAYKQNDWSGAQRWLDEAKNVDAGNEDAQSLQANLDVIEGRARSNDLGSRRVRDLAKAKTSGLQEQQQVVEKEAEYALRSGDLDAAESKYAAALELANELQKTEQLESAEQSVRSLEARRKLDEIQVQRSVQSSFGQANAPNAGGDAGFGWLGAEAEGQVLADDDVELYSPEESDESVAWAEPEPDGAAGMAPVVAFGDAGTGFETVTESGVVEGVVGGIIGGELHGAAGAAAGGTGVEISGLLGAVTGEEESGLAGLGVKGTGMGGGGSAEGLGGLGTFGTAGRGSGSGSGYGSGGGSANGRAGVQAPTVAVTIDSESVEVEEAKPVEQMDRYAEKAEVAATASRSRAPAPAKPAAKKSAKPAPAPSRSAAPAAPAAAAAPAYRDAPMSPPMDALKALGYADAAPPPPPPAPPPSPEPVTTTMSKDMLTKVPAGRSYQSTVSAAPGAVADGKKGESRRTAGPTGGKAKEKESREQDKSRKMDSADDDMDFSYAPMQELELPPEMPAAGDFEMEDLPAIVEDPVPDPNLLPRPRPAPERRAPLVASPSPMALAMPLDGPTLLTTQALQPADTFPTFTFRYKALPSENR